MSQKEQHERMAQRSSETRRSAPPLFDPTKINIPMSASARIRFEPNSRDAMNSRIWESIQYDTKEITSEVIKAAPAPIYMDMNPISSRTAIQSYSQEAQFFPDVPKQPPKKSGVSAPIVVATQSPGLISNPYLQRLDPVNDARNVPREMKSAVYEDNKERSLDAARVLAERQFTYRYLPEDEAAKAAALQAYELLRPKTDDYTKQFQH
jgi:hypothetical protein